MSCRRVLDQAQFFESMPVSQGEPGVEKGMLELLDVELSRRQASVRGGSAIPHANPVFSSSPTTRTTRYANP